MNTILIHKVPENPEHSSSPNLRKKDFSKSNYGDDFRDQHIKKLQIGNESVSTTPQTKSQTPIKSHGLLPNPSESEYIANSKRNINQIRSELDIIIPKENNDQQRNQDYSPIKIAYRRSSPNVFEKFEEFNQQLKADLDEGGCISNNVETAKTNVEYMYTDKKDDSTGYLNQNISTISATRIYIANAANRMDLDTSDFDKKEENENQNIKIQEVASNKILPIEEEVVSKNKWFRLSLVMRSLMLFQREEVKAIDQFEDIKDEINNFTLRRWKEPTNKKKDIASEDFAKDAFDSIRRIQVFCECAAVGSKDHLDLMERILTEDPKKFMFEPSDPSHLLNRKNNFGHTPMYIAAKNGNIEVIKLLVSKKANYKIESKIDKSTNETETPLQAAVRWHHECVVEYLLDNCEYDKKALKDVLKLPSTKTIKNLIRKCLMEKHGESYICLFSCFYCCLSNNYGSEIVFNSTLDVTSIDLE